uniref:Uncharacterized protein n=1 Tax=Arundo donax TaxID=35708 RepID=A0A0A9AKQ6_ARUDO
MLHTLFIFNL